MNFLAFYRDLEEQPLHEFICAPLLRSFFPSPHPHFRKRWWGQYQASKYWTWRKSSCLSCFALLPWQTGAGNIPVSAKKDITINTTIQMLNPNLDFMILFGAHSCGFQIRKASVHCVMTSQFVVKLWTIRESIRYSFFWGFCPGYWGHLHQEKGGLEEINLQTLSEQFIHIVNWTSILWLMISFSLTWALSFISNMW